MPNFTKIRPVGVEQFHVDGHTGLTDMTKLMIAFRNFTKNMSETTCQWARQFTLTLGVSYRRCSM
jgi:hypothetical protein